MAKEKKPTITKQENEGWDGITLNDEEGYYYIEIDTITDGNQSWINVSSTYENPKGFMGSCYGSGGDEQLFKDDPAKFFENMLHHKIETVKKPYNKIKTEDEWKVKYYNKSDFYRLVPSKNFYVIINSKLKDILKQQGFDFNIWYETYNNIQENESNEEYDKKIEIIREMLLKGLILENTSKDVKQSIRHKLGEKKSYGKETSDKYADKTIDELMKYIGEITLSIKEIDGKLGELWYKEHWQEREYYIYDAKDIIRIL